MAKSKNERKTEELVRTAFRDFGYYDASNDISVEEQKSHIEAVKRLLRAGSKSGKGGIGSPEFIVSEPHNPDFLVVVECKADPKDHLSQPLANGDAATLASETPEEYAKRVQKYAVDGALHYARWLSRDFNIIAIGITGETSSALKVSTYLHPKGAPAAKLLTTKAGKPVTTLLPWNDYIQHGTFDPTVQRLRLDELMAFSRELHDFMRDHAKVTESQKPLAVSGTLIALRNKAFAKSYDVYSPEELQKEWLKVIQSEIEKSKIPNSKKDNMAQPYSGLAVHPELGKSTKQYPKGALNELITRLNEKVWPFISVYHDFDVVGKFYGEFLKYTGGDKKALGIVLTPRHVTELCAMLANVNKNSTVLDICAGTGGFLISAMQQMMADASGEAERDRIKEHGLIGVEQQPDMFALAASNMILRGDGKANLHQGSCFDTAITAALVANECDVGLLNPPFSQGDADLHELYFIKHMLDQLATGGTGIAIAPMSCAISPHLARAELLKHHTLEAVMSMPDELFYPVGTITCLMVFTAKVPHATSKKKTWFGYWKDDGFIKTKHRGRIDPTDKWPSIRDHWVEMFRNREVHSGESVTRHVTEADEWCAEAYMQTDYSKLTQGDFEAAVRNYAIFKLLGAQIVEGEPTSPDPAPQDPEAASEGQSEASE